MKRLSLALLCIALIVGVAVAWFARPPIPEVWNSLQIGESIAAVRAKIPELKQYDDRMFVANGQVSEHWGVTYTWGAYLHFDDAARLVRFEGRSRNEITGLLDTQFAH
jgi:hypothetical protein